jgi:hypothetical protein
MGDSPRRRFAALPRLVRRVGEQDLVRPPMIAVWAPKGPDMGLPVP